jgi:translation initiation factor 3 subunit J
LLQIAAEKEAKARAEAEARRRVHDAARGDGEGEDGPVDDAAEKLRRQKLVEEADMDNARDLFGADDKGKKPAPAQGIDAMNPASRAEFDAFAKAMTDKLLQFDV